MKPEDLLFHLRNLSKKNPDGIPMFYFKSMICRRFNVKNKQWSFMMRYLVSNQKIEMFGVDQRIKPIDNGIKSYEVKINENLIKDILSEVSPCSPEEAYKHCILKYGYCNPESFTRLMRKMAEEGKIRRDGTSYCLRGSYIHNTQRTLI